MSTTSAVLPRRLAGALALAAAVSLLAPQPGVCELSEERRRQLDRFVGQFVDLAMFDGTVLVDVAGEIVYQSSFGLAHYELGVAHDEATRFRIASVSKTVTDAAFAVLVQRGTLRLETPLSRFLPDFPAADRITVHHLLSHRSGIPHTNDQPWGDGRHSLTLHEIVERLAALPLDFEPGSDSRYSNGAYAVAARVLELATGEPFAGALRSTVLDPLGMEETGHIEDARRPIAGMATGYEPGTVPGERRHVRFYAVETRPGGGSFYSTARDLHRFARGVFRQGFISEELRASVLGADGGEFLAQGRSPGFVVKLYYSPDSDVIVVSLANSYAVPADWARAIASVVTGEPDVEPWGELRWESFQVPADDPRLGRYRNSRGGGELEIVRTPEGIMVLADPASESTTALVPLSDGAFLLPIYYQRCSQERETRVITCRMLSGNERYTSRLSPL